MINAQDYVNSLPVEDALAQARRELENDLAQLPSFDGAGYTATDGSAPTAYILLSGKKYEVEFNLLDPESIQDNIIKLITGLNVPR